MRRALVIGSAGQDGRILTEQLVEDGWTVVGVDLGTVTQSTPVWPAFSELDLGDRVAVDACIRDIRPDATYYLAAYHHSSEEAQGDDLASLYARSHEVHVTGWLHVLDALLRLHPQGRSFYAASSHVFGEPDTPTQNEQTPFRPVSPYAITKVAGIELARLYRRRGLHASTGILYNHESPLRPEKFVSQRIVRGAVAARRAVDAGQPYTLELGNLSAVVDWSWAADVTRAMQLIVAHETPDDYVVGSGVPHTIADFCRIAFECVGLDYRDFVRERGERLHRQVGTLVADLTRLAGVPGIERGLRLPAWVPRLVESAFETPEH